MADRAANLAIIDAAILDAQPKDATLSQPSTKIYDPGATLPIVPKEEEKEQVKLTKEQEAILKEQEKLLGKEEAERLRAEQEYEANKHAALKAGETAIRKSQDILHGADTRIGSVPTPGSIALPLLLLLLFFFILIQVNGFSRIGWLWMVITRNAQVTTTQQAPPVGQGGEQTSIQKGQPAAKLPTMVEALAIPRFSTNGTYGGPY